MRTALRRIRDEQGPDAVILSSHQLAEGGVEVVAATDYDEALVQQTLRTMTTPAPRSAPEPQPAPHTVPEPNHHERAVFHIDGVPVTPAEAAAASVKQERSSSRIEQVMSVFSARKPAAETTAALQRIEPTLEPQQDLVKALRRAPKAAQTPVAATAPPAPAPIPAQTPAQALREALANNPATRLVQPPAPPVAAVAQPAPAPAVSTTPAPPLRSVETDPAVTALRAELSSMRKMIERELGQFAGERLRGSPARAAALDMLAAFGCSDTLAQQIAGQLDPALSTSDVVEVTRNALAAQLPIATEDPLEKGGVIALLGPTGAGKTTTIAKLAARYAARHRARDVALISADNERTGAREQLHALGRRLGVTVCDADGPEGLTHALEQLADYPLVLIDTAGYGLRDRGLLRQILWVRGASNVRCMLVVPANGNPADLSELLKRYRSAAPEATVLTKLDESTCLGAALSVLVQHNLPMAYTASGQQVPDDIELADARCMVSAIDFPRRAGAASPLHDDGHHAFA